MTAAAPIVPAPNKRPLWIGALVGPLAAPFAAAPLALLLDPHFYVSFKDVFALFPVVAVVALVGAYAGMVALGLPTVLLLRKAGHLSAPLLCALAMPLGGAPPAFAWITATPPGIQEALMGGMFGAGVALAVAVAFCIASGLEFRSRKQSLD